MPQTEQRQKLRENFMESFVRALILNSYKPEEKKEIKTTTNLPATSLQKFPEKKVLKIPQRRISPIIPEPQKIPTGSPIPLPIQNQTKQKPGQKPETINLGKIAAILKDPSVFGVECPGPGKNLRVNRSGAIQTAPTILAKEEIQTIMENLSEKTRIPLVQGVFKAAIQDLLVTAVVSDFVGTRFMIQKRTPFQRF
ncbi:MAG: hypothetical protein KJ600_02885 [Nanoarchaeota archaeon]|nr:hypothetical protein [Nanoarchaeota archaeon]MBU1103474.1 hypothetical protein [Nanoarchaeota archaeon]